MDEDDLGPHCTGSASLKEQVLGKIWKAPTRTWTAQDMASSCKKGHEGHRGLVKISFI